MKATNSKDGQMRINFKVTYRYGVNDFVDAVACVLVMDGDPFSDTENPAMRVEAALKAFKSRKAILAAAENAIRRRGEAVWAWTDGVNKPVVETLCEQIRVLVEKKFPELKSRTAI